MIPKIISRFFLFNIIFYASCNVKKCDSFLEYFSSTDDAITKIRSWSFEVRDSINSSGGEWLKSVSYYSCDGKSGFLIFTLKSGSEGFNQNVPFNVWNEFKNADTKEFFYEDKIRTKFPGQILLKEIKE